MSQVRLVNLKKVYQNGVMATHDLNLEIAEKEFLVLVGPSGSGKSTILRMIAGLEDLTDGEIYIGDKKVNDIPPKDRDIAMVFQDFALYPHMNVFDNIAFGLKMRKVPREEIQTRVNEAAGILGIEGLLQRKPRQISGGEKQRVALGRAMVRHPRVFLMDEPLSNLDAKLRVQMRAEIYRLYRSLDTTVVYVTHDQTEAMTMGTRIVVLKDGVIQQADSPRKVYNKPVNTFVASFIGTPPMNLMEGQLRSANEHLSVDLKQGFIDFPHGIGIPLPASTEKNVVVGIRPEDIRIVPPGSGRNEIEGEVEMIELMGAESCISIACPCGNIVAKIHDDRKISNGDQVGMSFNTDKVHLFEKNTGNRIVY